MTPAWYTLCTILIISFVIADVYTESTTASVFRIIPKNDEDLKILYSFDRDLDGTMFWKDPTGLNKSVDLMVPTKHIEIFKTALKDHGLEYNLEVQDVQKLLNKVTARKKRNRNNLNFPETFGWRRFQTLDEIYAWLDSLAAAYPNNVKIIVGGHSHEGRPIKGVQLTFAPNKAGVFIEAGIHAREWLSHSTATYLINALLTSTDQDVRQLAESFEWYIFPCFNPDGYVFTHSDPENPSVRLWRKTTTPYQSKWCWNQHSCTEQTCYGTDLNRNWGFGWGGPGSGHDACGEVYAGPRAFSERESQTMSQFITSVSGKLFAYISFHTYIEKLMFPYGHTSEHLDNYDQQFAVGVQAVNGLSKKYGTRFAVGNIAEVLGGPASGGSIDWVKANFKIPFVYCYELRGETTRGLKYGFLAPPSEIIPSGEEVVDSLVAMFRAAAEYYPQLNRDQQLYQ